MKLINTEFEGLYIVEFNRFEDHRGVLIKPWVADELEEVFGSNMEAYISSSHARTIRGLHYQRGAAAQKKYVTCVHGKIEDVAIDMRPQSETYGQSYNITLAGMDGRGVIVPAGFAHGVYAYEDSIIVNISDQKYAPGEEAGIHWSSVKALKGLPVDHVSDKDSNLPLLEDVIR